MKRSIILLFILTCISFSAMAQKVIAEIWTQPAFFKADEQVTIFFDVTGTPLDGSTEDIYIWTWFPSDKTGITDANKLTKVEGNVWKFTMTPTDFYGKTVAEISEFYGLLRNSSGSKLTDAFAPDQVASGGQGAIAVPNLTIISGTATFDYFPKKYQSDRPLSILVNTKNTWSNCETTAKQGDLTGTTELYLHSGANNWTKNVEFNDANKSKVKFTDLGNGIFKFDMVPDEYFGNPSPNAYNVKFVVANSDWSKVGKDASCADFMIGSAEAPVIPVPILSFFPQKISQKDLLLITRVENEEDVTKLTYTISAVGVADFSGDFVGNTAKFEAYIDLVSNLSAVSKLDKIHLTIKDNKGRTVTSTDIPLVVLQ